MRKAIVVSAMPTKFDAVAFRGQVEDNLRKIAGLGYDGVELAIRDPKLIDAGAVLGAAAQFGLGIAAIGTGQAWGEEGLSFSDPDPSVRRAAIERAKSHIGFAKRSGALIIIGLLRGVIQPGVDRAQAMAWVVDAFKECAEAASAEGVGIAVEPINRYETPLLNTAAEGMEFLEAVGADNLGLMLDTFHMNIEEPQIVESIRMVGPRLWHFHVADSNRWYPGAGHIDFPKIVATLRDIGYTGYVSAEAMPVPDADTCAVKSLAAMRSWGL